MMTPHLIESIIGTNTVPSDPDVAGMVESAEKIGVSTTLLWVLVGILLALVVGTVIRLSLLSSAAVEKRKEQIGSLMSWWVLAVMFVAVVLLGRVAAIVAFGATSLWGLKEFLSLTALRHAGRGLRELAFLAVLLNYLWIYLGWQQMFWAFMPVCVCLLLPARVILTDRPEGFIQAVATVAWGTVLLGFCFPHVAVFFLLSETSNSVAGAPGWVLYLVILTEMNDIAQALWGRKFGKRKLTPVISPNKTWEGLILGTLSTLVLAVVLAPLLTPLADPRGVAADGSSVGVLLAEPLLAGLIIAVSGSFGDLTMSAVKRDVGVKDSGNLIPGQGGLLDRIDSLTFSAPVFFYFVYFLHP